MTTYYEKTEDGEFVPALEFFSGVDQGLPRGHHLVSIYPGVTITTRKVEPDVAMLMAAAVDIREELTDYFLQLYRTTEGMAAEYSPTEEAIINQALSIVSSKRLELYGKSPADAAGDVVDIIFDRGQELYETPAVRLEWDRFQTVAALSKK